LDRSLLFRLLIVAPGYEPTFFPKVDPLKGPLEALLKARNRTNPISQTILGRVVDAEQRPVPRAVVSVDTTVIGNTFHGWPPDGTDPLAVTDDNGEFSISSPAKFDSMMLRVEARAMARGMFSEVRPGPKRRDLKVTEGAAIKGRVLWKGQPLKDVVIGACGTDRTIGNFTGDFVMACQGDGRFLLPNMPPDREYFIYGLMNSLTNYGTLPLTRVKPGGDGNTYDLGKVEVSAGNRLAGQVELADGNPVPPGTRLTIGRDDAWDVLAVLLPEDGRFDIPNLPANEPLNLSVALKGYRPSARNASFERLNGFGLAGQLQSDKTNLVFLLEPGKTEPGQFDNEPEEEQPRRLPLGGIEVRRTSAPGWTVSGHVLDATSKRPLSTFRVTPGETFQAETGWIQWLPSRAVDGTNGQFSVEVPRRARFAVLQAEAEGYLPTRSAALKAGQTNCTLELRAGSGPSGVLLDVNGQPAAGITVLHLGPGEQSFLAVEGELRYSGMSQVQTDDQGRFSFAPKFGDSEIIAASASGFAKVPASQVQRSGNLQLSAWAGIKGRLVEKGKPVANENLDLRWAGGFNPAAPYLNLGGTKTDEDGRFSFSRVPIGALELTTRQNLGQNMGGWSSTSQKSVTTRAGELLDVGDVEKKHGSQ
jgi:uncharacterized GH25 family protein